jgi:hypothetical protein
VIGPRDRFAQRGVVTDPISDEEIQMSSKEEKNAALDYALFKIGLGIGLFVLGTWLRCYAGCIS